MKKFYAVKKGHKPGIYDTWEECKKQTDSFSGKEFKSFKTFEEAQNYLNSDTNDAVKTEIELLTEKETLNAFTDGSFDEELNISSYGIVYIDNEGKVTMRGGFIEDTYGSRNVTGEVEGVIEAINRAIYLKIKKLRLFYDLNLIGKWANKEFKANTPVAVNFVSFLDKNKDKIEIEFINVKGHSGIEYNELADKIASNQIKSIKPATENTYGFTSYRYNDSDIEIMLSTMRSTYEGFHFIKEVKSNHNVYKCQYENAKLTIKKYSFKAGNALLVEKGTSDGLFALVVSHLNDFGRIDQILPVMNAQFKKGITKKMLEETLYNIAPKLKDIKIDTQVYRLIVQAIYNYVQEFEDFGDLSYLMIPATRALEGQLKIMLKEDLNITIEKNSFFCFDKNELGIYVLQKAHYDQCKQKSIDVIEKCYNLYNGTRHVYSHFGNPDLQDTRFLNQQDSKEKIKDIILNISKYY